MPKWSGRVFFPTSSAANRALAQGRYPRLPQEVWKRPDRGPRRDPHKEQLDGILLTLKYGLRHMPDRHLKLLEALLQDAEERNRQRWVPLPMSGVTNALRAIEGEWHRRQTMLNAQSLLEQWPRDLHPHSSTRWTAQDASTLEDHWAQFMEEQP